MDKLTPKERARCDHPERKMAASGRMSWCWTCFYIGMTKSLQRSLETPQGSSKPSPE